MVSATGFLVLFLIGVVSAVFGSIVGLGGGVIIVPSLILLAPRLIGESVDSAVAVGTSLVVLIFTALSSTLTFVRQRRVDFRSGLLFFVTSGPGAIVGAAVTGLMSGGRFQLVFGIFVLCMAILMMVRDRLKPLRVEWRIRRSYTDPKGVVHTYGYNAPLALLIGFCVGFVSGLFGIGGGSLFVPLMVLLFRFPPHVATATSMFVIFLSAILGSFSHVAQDNVNWWAVLALAPGALFGGWAGARIAGKLSSKTLLYVLRATLLVFSLYLIWRGAVS
jgi:hypothetical protein